MAAVALSLDRHAEDAVLSGVLAAGQELVARVQTAGELAAVLAARQLDVAVVGVSRSRLTVALVSAAAASGARLVAIAASDDEHARATALGVEVVLDAPCEWPDIEAALLARATALATAAARSRAGAGAGRDARSSGEIHAVWGPAGAPGRTTIAIACAAELAATGSSVVLIDADPYGGAVAPALALLDEAPGFAAACRLAASDAFTRAEFERVSRYLPAAGPFAVLSGLPAPSRWPELADRRVCAVLAACAGWFEHVVVDVGFNLESDEEIVSDVFAPRRNAATLAVLGEATHLVAVGAGDPVGLARLLRAHPDAVAAAPQARRSLLVNKIRADVLGAAPERQLADALARFGGLEADAFVPFEPAAFDAALRDGRPVGGASTRSPSVQRLQDFTRTRVLGLPQVPARRLRKRAS